MDDLRDKIKEVIEKEKKNGHFSVLDSDASVNLIQQILENYEKTNGIKRDFNDLPKKAELVFLAAPTGAGKDCLVVRLNHNNPEKKYIELNMDIFRHYYPQYIKDTTQLTDKNYANMTNEFSYEIYMTLQTILLQEFPGTNIIITGTLRETDWVERVFERVKSDTNTDYKVKLACLAVPKKQSALSVIERYVKIVNSQNKKKDFHPGTARFTTMEYHDETFEKFPENLKYFQEMFLSEPGKLIDSMEVYRRAKNKDDLGEDTLIYSSEKTFSPGLTALDMVEKLRNSNAYEMEIDKVKKLFGLIKVNFSYLKSQGTLRDVLKDLAVLLEYPKIAERIDKLPTEGVEPDL